MNVQRHVGLDNDPRSHNLCIAYTINIIYTQYTLSGSCILILAQLILHSQNSMRFFTLSDKQEKLSGAPSADDMICGCLSS